MKRIACLTAALMFTTAAIAGPGIPVPPEQFDHVPTGVSVIDSEDFFNARAACTMLRSGRDYLEPGEGLEFNGGCVKIKGGNDGRDLVVVGKADAAGFSKEDHDRALRAEFGKINQYRAGDPEWYRTDGAHGWSFRP